MDNKIHSQLKKIYDKCVQRFFFGVWGGGCRAGKTSLYLHVRKSSETIPFEPEISRVDVSPQLLGINPHIFPFIALSPSSHVTSQIQLPET